MCVDMCVDMARVATDMEVPPVCKPKKEQKCVDVETDVPEHMAIHKLLYECLRTFQYTCQTASLYTVVEHHASAVSESKLIAILALAIAVTSYRQ